MNKTWHAQGDSNWENKPHWPYETHEAHEPQPPYGGRPLAPPQPFLPKKGNYRDLLVYQKAECIYDITFYFAHHYFAERKDRTIDQVIQAARSGYRSSQKAEIECITAENQQLKATIAQLQTRIQQLESLLSQQ